MKNKTYLTLSTAALLCALAGCAYSPTEVIQQGSRFKFAGQNKPEITAKCLARNADNLDASLQGQVRPGETAGTQEVIVRMLGASVSTVGVFQIKPLGQGSEITSYISHNIYISHEEFSKRVIGSCQKRETL